MIRLTLPSSLGDLLYEDGSMKGRPRRPTSVTLDVESWDQVAREIRSRFPRLADRVLTESGMLAQGFLLALNDDVIPSGAAFVLDSGDELYLFAQVAGG